MSRFGIKPLLQELRRRRLFNTVAIYVVGAWVALQVAELALPGLAIPDIAIRYVWIAAFLLFPLVLVFGWRYDISSGGVRRTPPSPDSEASTTLRGTDRWLISGMSMIALAIILTMGVRISQVEPGVPRRAQENSIAVLPFEVCTGQARDGVLAGGVTTEVMSRLAERGRFKVFARTSTDLLAGFGLPGADLARALGSEYLLTGELCREATGELVLAAELSDADGFIVWGERFVETVNPFEQITGRLASMVAAGAAAHLGDTLALAPEEAVNKKAYEQNLIGWEYRRRGEDDKARAAFDAALQHQPGYAEATFGLALTELGAFGSPDEGSRIERAKPIVEDALALAERRLASNPRDADAHFVTAGIRRALAIIESELLWRRAGELSADDVEAGKNTVSAMYAQAEEHYRAAITLNPSLTRAYAELAYVIERQGVEREGEALEVLERAQARDPLDWLLNARIAQRWAGRGRFRQAIELLQRFEELPEVPAPAWWWQLELMTLQGYWAEKGETLVEMLSRYPEAFEHEGNRWQAWWFTGQLLELGLYEEARAWCVRLVNVPLNEFLYSSSGSACEEPVEQPAEPAEPETSPLGTMSDEQILDAFSGSAELAAQELASAGHLERAIGLMESIQHAPALWSERSQDSTLYLARLYLRAGRSEDATPLLDRVRTHLEARYADGMREPGNLSQLAEVYVLLGRGEDGLGMLRAAVDYHLFGPCDMQDFSEPPWDRLQDDPRLAELCGRMQAEFDQQATRLRRLLAQYDPDELLAPLMAFADSEEAG